MAQTSVYTTEAGRWGAVLGRERAAVGAFYYAVKTTGVFCSPGCPSRLPRYENVVFYDTGEAAVQAGYRPCQRCKPCSVPSEPVPVIP